MATHVDISATISAAVTAGSLRMLANLQKELRQTAVALHNMGDTATASALGHTAMALDRVQQAAGKITDTAKKAAESTKNLTQKAQQTTVVAKNQTEIFDTVSRGFKLNAAEATALEKAISKLGSKYGYAVNAQKAWVPALTSSLNTINNQRAALVANGKALTKGITSAELYDTANRKIALGTEKITHSLTDYGKALDKSVGRSEGFRNEVTNIAKSFGVQGEAFNSQHKALVKVDDAWRTHVTTMQQAGLISTKQANEMYNSNKHLGLSATELNNRIKASNGTLKDAASYNQNARKELDAHNKAMKQLVVEEGKLAAISGKTISAVQKETEALMKSTKSMGGVISGLKNQQLSYKDLAKKQALVAKSESNLAKVTGTRVKNIQRVTKSMLAQGKSYEAISKHLDALAKKHGDTTKQLGRVSRASDTLRKTNAGLAKEIDALGRIRLKNIVHTKASAQAMEYLHRKFPTLTEQVTRMGRQMAMSNMSVVQADKVLTQMRGSMGRAVTKVSLFDRAMSSLVSHLKSFASYAAAATIISGIAATFGYAISAVIKYDQALKDLQAITQATDRETALMGEKIREVGRTTKFSAIEVAGAMRTLGQAGLTAVESMRAIDSVASLATGTLTSMQTVVDLVTTAIRAFDLDASEASHVSDIFANAVNRSKLTIDKLRVAFNYIGPIAAKAGISLEETAATTMLLANAGVRASTTGTGLRRTIQQLIDPTDELKAAIAAAGYSTEDFNPQLNDMRDVIRRLSIVVPDAEAAFSMFALRSASAVAALSSTGVEGFDKLLSATKRTGSAMEMQKTQLEGLSLIYKQARDKATDLALSMGDAGVTSALKSMGKGLQTVLDYLKIFIESGVVRVVAEFGFWALAIAAVRKAWAMLQMSTLIVQLRILTSQILAASTATKALSVAATFLYRKLGPVILILAALSVASELLAATQAKVNEVDTEFVKTVKEANIEERKRLELINNAVTLAQDELASDAKRTEALKKLQKELGGLNLKLGESDEIIEDFDAVLTENADKFEEWSKMLDDFDNTALAEDLLLNAELYDRTSKAIGVVIEKLEQAREENRKYGKEAEGAWNNMIRWTDQLVNLIPFVGSSYLTAAEELEMWEEAYKKLTDESSTAHKSMMTDALTYAEMTQETWEDQMFAAGAAYSDIVGMVEDKTAKITAEHLRMYLEIRAARGTYAHDEQKNVDLSVAMFKRLSSTKQSILQRDLKLTREKYSDLDGLVRESYDREVTRIQTIPDLTGESYDSLLDILTNRYKRRNEIIEQSYNEQWKLIDESGLKWKEKEEEKEELLKRTENSRKQGERELTEDIRNQTDRRLEILSANHAREASILQENLDRQIDAIDRYYQHGIDQAEMLFEKSSGLGDKILEYERRRYEDTMEAAEDSYEGQLDAAEKYHEAAKAAIEKGYSQDKELHAKQKDELLKVEEEYKDKLLEVNEAYSEERLEILKGWGDFLKEKYDEAVDNTRDYAEQVIELEKEIQEVREETAEKLREATEKTEDLIRKINRASMSDTEEMADRYAEAQEKKAKADKLMAQGTEESISRALELYKEVQETIADLGVEAAEAAKKEQEARQKVQDKWREYQEERLKKNKKAAAAAYKEWEEAAKEIGKKKITPPIDVEGSKTEVKNLDQSIQDAINKLQEFKKKALEDEQEMAGNRQDQWEKIADLIDERFGKINRIMKELGGGVEGLAGELNKLDDTEFDVTAIVTGESDARALKAAIDQLESKDIYVTTHYRQTGTPPAGKAEGGLIGKQTGGPVPGSGDRDTVPAMLTPGEFVIKKESVTKYGLSFLKSVNEGLLRLSDFLRYSAGGLVSKPLVGEKANVRSLDKFISSTASAVDRMLSSPSGTRKEADTLGMYRFKLDIGSASIVGEASKNVLDRFQADLRRQELARGLA